MKTFEIRAEHKAIVHDEIVFIVSANSKEEAIQKLKDNSQENDDWDMIHSEELEREDLETLWEEAEIEEIKNE